MAIISSYPIIGAMQDNDAWIGTDFATKQTKQYTADSLADYLNTNNKIDIGVASINGGSGITITGTASIPTVSVDYSSINGSNLVQAAIESTTATGIGNYSPYILMNESYPNNPDATVKKIRLGNISLDRFGTATRDVNMGNQLISNLANPANALDAVNKAYVDALVEVDYSAGASNLVQAATTITSPGGAWNSTPYILLSDSNQSESYGEVKKIRIGDIPLDLMGDPTGSVFLGQQKIVNLASPVNADDAVNKAYVDAAVVGGLFYQGGYDASTNTPDIVSLPNNILKGWTYTVTADGSLYGEQLRVGDVLIAETNSPSGLNSWTIVQNNIDLASATQVGIGNVAAGTNMSVSYSNGTATLNNTFSNQRTSGFLPVGTTSKTITHNFGSKDVLVYTYAANGDEVFCEVARPTTNTVVVSVNAGASSSNINITVVKL